MWTHVTAILVPTRHKQQRCCLNKDTKEEGSFIQKSKRNKKRWVAPCTENKIYFALLLLYVKLGHFQSCELLRSLFLSGRPEVVCCLFSHNSWNIHACCHVLIIFSSYPANNTFPFAFPQYELPPLLSLSRFSSSSLIDRGVLFLSPVTGTLPILNLQLKSSRINVLVYNFLVFMKSPSAYGI